MESLIGISTYFVSIADHKRRRDQEHTDSIISVGRFSKCSKAWTERGKAMAPSKIAR